MPVSQTTHTTDDGEEPRFHHPAHAATEGAKNAPIGGVSQITHSTSDRQLPRYARPAAKNERREVRTALDMQSPEVAAAAAAAAGAEQPAEGDELRNAFDEIARARVDLDEAQRRLDTAMGKVYGLTVR